MEDTTTTESSSQDVSSEDTSQLEQAIDDTAEVATDEQTDGSEAASPDTDEDLAWLRNKGIDPEDPEFARKAAQLARTTEREFHKSRAEVKSQLQDATSASYEDEYGDPTAQRLQVLETRVAVQDFYSSNPDAKDMDADMAKIVQEKPYLAQDLDAVYAIAKSSRYESELKAAETKGADRAKQEIARSSGAPLPKGNASSDVPAPKLTREQIGNMSAQEYATRRDEIYAAFNSGKL